MESNILLTSSRYKDNLSFWKERLTKIDQAFILNSYLRDSRKEQKNDYRFKLPEKSNQWISEVSGGDDLGAFVILFSCISYVFHRYADEKVFYIETPLYKPSIDDKIVGNKVPIVLDFNSISTARDLMVFIQNEVSNSYSYQNIPVYDFYKLLMNDKNIEPGIVVAFDKIHSTLGSDNCKLAIDLKEIDGVFEINIKSKDLSLSSEFLEQFSIHLNNVIHSFSKDLHRELNTIEILSSEERVTIENYSKGDFYELKQNNVVEVFEEQVKRNPSNNALIFKEKKYSYQEINELSNKLAHYLKLELNIRTGDVVGVIIDKSEYSIIALLAILKTGGVYLPISTDFPEQRRNIIINESKVKSLIIQSDYFDYVSGLSNISVLAIDLQLNKLNTSNENLKTKINIYDAAYIIYTSGSTGEPKGVMIPHIGILNVSLDHISEFNILENDVVMQFFSLAFDGAYLDIFMALLSGGSLLLPDKDITQDKHKFLNYLNDNKVSILSLTPSYLGILGNPELPTVKVLVSAGEIAKSKDLKSYSNSIAVYNGYGPTEASVNSTLYRVVPNFNEEELPIGSPRANKIVKILDSNQKLLPIGVVGEICISSHDLAIKYINDEDYNNEKFVKNISDNSRFYKTGDYGYWSNDGNLYFIGRKDDQVKINGFRVDISEIERILISTVGIDDGVILIKKDGNGKDSSLVCFYCKNKEGENKDIENELKVMFTSALPYYMIPDIYIELEELPRTIQDKVDKRALLGKINLEAESDVVKNLPSTSEEKKLANIWSEVLEVNELTTHSDFFKLGGNSLKAIQMLSQVHEEFNVELEVQEVFVNSTIKDFAKLLSGTGSDNNFYNIQSIPENEFYNLSHAQKRLWLIEQSQGYSIAYNIPGGILITGDFDVSAFKKALNLIVKRHEALRTIFKLNKQGVPVQYIKNVNDLELKIDVVDLSNFKSKNDKLKQIVKDEQSLSFDISKDILIRAKIIRITESKYLFLYTTHHIISDGWSMKVILKELSILYNSLIKGGKAIGLPELKIQYKDFAAWESEMINSAKYESNRSFWKSLLSSPLPKARLLTDYNRPEDASYQGDLVTLNFDDQIKNEIFKKTGDENLTLFMFLFTSVMVLMNRTTKQSDLILGTVVSGRNHSDLNDQVGFYMNTLPIRTRFEENDTISKIFKKIQKLILDVYEYQNYPFDQILEDLQTDIKQNTNPLFDVIVTLQNLDLSLNNVELSNIELNNYEIDHKVSLFDLNFMFEQVDDQLNLVLKYRKDLFERNTILLYLNRLKNVMRYLIANDQTKIQDIKIDADDTIEILGTDLNLNF